MLQPQEQEGRALLDSFEGFEDKSLDIAAGPRTGREPPRKARKLSRSLYWIAALLLAIGVTDLLSVIYVVRIFRTHYAATGTSELEMANPYVGLDELYRSGQVNSSTIDPIMTKARVVAQVYSDRPRELAPIGEHDVFGKYGYLTPREQHLQVNPTTHTIVQFRAIDYGMEDCSLVVRLPTLDAPLESKEPFLLTQPSRLEFCALDAQRPLDIRKLSWKSRPKCERKMGALEATPGQERVVARFPCAWGTLHTFEVGCADGSDCLVDVWSSQNMTWGIWMHQYQTV